MNLLEFSRFFPKKSGKTGKPPGTVQYLGKKRIEDVTINIATYDYLEYFEKTTKDVNEIKKYINKKKMLWINVNGVHKTEIIEKIGEIFKLHPLLLEDIANVDQRPKIEYYDDLIFVIFKIFSFNETKKTLTSEQISLIIGKNFVLSFQENDKDDFDIIRNRLKKSGNKIRKLGSDYLMYTLMDYIIDSYFIVLENIGEYIEQVEQDTIFNPSIKTQNEIYSLKRELILLRKSVWPLREVLSSLQRENNKLISKEILFFLRDIYDHTIQIIDTVETFRDMLSGMLDLYLSNVSNKMNEVMKILTVIATIFIPLTFIVGIYGMNFRYMPELEIWWFYPSLWGVMVGVALLMFFAFKKKGWV
ncbi:magnesium/cobalt transporter CorA [Candidatus Pacearchaeota archaeon]|nr:magnesium/cobalt transporter CorA [Candidatus Pacearchaeota archaeon]